MTCVFCTDPSASGEVVFENGDALVVVHPDWAVRGHLMVASKRHVENPSSLPAGEWAAIAALWHRVEGVLLELTGAGRAVAMKLGIATPHLHVHLYPVSASAGRDEVFAAIEGRSAVAPDPAFVADLRRRLGSVGSF